MGLIGVTAAGGDSGRVLARDQAMDGMVEADLQALEGLRPQCAEGFAEPSLVTILP